MKDYFAFQWHITDNCDQRCKHCYIFSEDNDKPLQTASFNDIKKIFKNCQDMCEKLNRQPYFYITGGDPILHPDFWKILGLFKENNILFEILGNPFHLTDKICGKLKEYGCRKYQLSIDGLEDTHDYFRKKGSFKTTLDKIKCINNAKIKSVIMTTVSKTNINEIPEIIDIAVENNVDIFAFARYCPTNLDKHTHITPEEYHTLLDTCWNKFEEYKDSKTSFNLKDHLWTLYLYEKGLFNIPNNLKENTIYDGCNCANSHMTILPDGSVYACRRMESKVGNALTENMEDIFLSKSMNKYRQYDKFNKCSKCELLRFCRGCPAVSYGYTHNYYSADPQCWKKISSK